jgi:hypothetical protein
MRGCIEGGWVLASRPHPNGAGHAQFATCLTELYLSNTSTRACVAQDASTDLDAKRSHRTRMITNGCGASYANGNDA